MSDSALDINATFRGGGCSVEFLDQINRASIVMLAETGIVPRDVAQRQRQRVTRRTGKWKTEENLSCFRTTTSITLRLINTSVGART